MKQIIFIALFLCTLQSFGQNYNEKTSNVFGTFHTTNTTINGVSVGAFPQLNTTKRYVLTNGIRLEVPGIGFLGLLANGSLIPREATSEKVNGLNISSGTLGNVKYNGLTLALGSQNGTEQNGIALAGFGNSMQKSNGLMVSFMYNETNYSNGLQISLGNHTDHLKGIQIGGFNTVNENMVGLQIGLFNESKKTKGLQIGLWNINEKRKLPFINWNI